MNKKGFTLIELLIVMAVLGVLATFVVVQFTGTQDRAADTKRKAELHQYQNALEVYATRNNGVFPVQASTVNAVSICGALGLTGACPSDPKLSAGWDDYKYQSTLNGLDYVLWAHLEQGNQDYFVLCSNGTVKTKASATWVDPVNGVCP